MNDSRISKSRPSISPYAIEYRIDPDSPFPIEAMVRASGMSLADVARRMGYINVNKGLRRLFDLMQGDTQHGEHIAPQLAQALGLDQQAVDVAIEDTRYIAWARADRAFRAKFRPYATWRFERTRPSAFVGAGSSVPPLVFDEDIPPEAMLAMALAAAPEGAPLFGRTIGIWMNYAPDKRVLYGLDGQPMLEPMPISDRAERGSGL